MVDVAERNEKKRLSVARRRNALRSDGYRPVQLWVPDLRNLEVRSACLRDLEAIRDDPPHRSVFPLGNTIRCWKLPPRILRSGNTDRCGEGIW